MDQDGGKLTILQRDEGKHGDIIFLFPIKRMVLLAFDKLTFEIFLHCKSEKGHRITKAETYFWTKDKRPGEKLGGTSL